MAVMQAAITGLQNDQQCGVRAFIRSPNGWQTAPDANGFCTPMTFSPILSQNSWAQIDAASRAGLAPTLWKVGDEKDITLTTGERLTLQIYGFNHDDLTGGGKAGITFGLKNLMTETRLMNSTATNVGGFTGSELYSWLISTVQNQMPADLRSMLKSINKRTSVGGGTQTINTYVMKLFLFSEVECFGSIMYSMAGEGTKYAIFTDNLSRKKFKSNGVGVALYWWERSPYAVSVNSAGFCNVYDDGSIHAFTANAFLMGINFGFCV